MAVEAARRWGAVLVGRVAQAAGAWEAWPLRVGSHNPHREDTKARLLAMLRDDDAEHPTRHPPLVGRILDHDGAVLFDCADLHGMTS